MSSTQEEEYDDGVIPFSVTEEVNPDEVGDLTDQRDGADAIEPARDVVFCIKQGGASLDIQKNGPDWVVKRLKVQAAIGPLGTDGEGKYAGKVFFPEFVLVFNEDALRRLHEENVAAGKKKDKPFNAAWWRNEARFDFKEFALATGLAVMQEDEGTGRKAWKMSGPINDETLVILGNGDVEFLANILKNKDNYKGEGYFKNDLKKFRPVAQGEAE